MNILVCDDQLDYLNLIVKKVKECYHAEMELKVSTVTNREKLLEILRYTDFHLAIVEMKMCKGKGVAIAKTIKRIIPSCRIMFISDTYMNIQKAFQVNPLYYLSKPINTIEFQEQMDRVVALFRKKDVKFYLNTRQGKNFILRPSEIIYVQTYYADLEISTKNGLIETDGKNRRKLFNQLIPRQFLKINQSTLINMDEIQIATLHNVILKSGEIFNISGSRIMKCHIKYDEYVRNKDKIVL